VEDFIAATVFVTALAALFVMTVATLKPFLPSKIVEVPAAPSKDAPTIRVYVYNHTGRLYAVEYAGDNPEAFRRALGVPGSLVAVFTIYPGGYNCTRYARPREDRARPLHRFVVPAALRRRGGGKLRPRGAYL